MVSGKGINKQWNDIWIEEDGIHMLKLAYESLFKSKEAPSYIGDDYVIHFDNIKDVSELKNQYTYYEEWKAVFEGKKQENINKMLEGKEYSRIDIRFELSVVNENKAILSVRYIALP